MTSIDAFTGVRVAGAWRTLHVPAITAAAMAAPRKRRAAAGATAPVRVMELELASN